ncbi:eCIS core domain-containing protein [Candidatus Uabimicrobium amorphum]|uniref:eCIS core domain-containing protein n=1 Tax=Uabimicrobium amorphum TaxID=2596890 RepID=A0A5S9F5B5_UABAM|nr:DUF4157 domain-containing protein [Candidatus Uabimicrobium amorphum]BBM86675.1 hypothetical protein UABAM_05061 [Candidatus Uabimicrobium amorphum]
MFVLINTLPKVILPQLPKGCQPIPVELRLERNSGNPLPDSIRSKMENLFDADFSDVRIHVGKEASQIGALAFTWGSDIYFAENQYNPTTHSGIQILGHELTHVVQQRSGRAKNPSGSGIVILDDPKLEAEAEYYGDLAAQKFAGSIQPRRDSEFNRTNRSLSGQVVCIQPKLIQKRQGVSSIFTMLNGAKAVQKKESKQGGSIFTMLPPKTSLTCKKKLNSNNLNPFRMFSQFHGEKLNVPNQSLSIQTSRRSARIAAPGYTHYTVPLVAPSSIDKRGVRYWNGFRGELHFDAATKKYMATLKIYGCKIQGSQCTGKADAIDHKVDFATTQTMLPTYEYCDGNYHWEGVLFEDAKKDYNDTNNLQWSCTSCNSSKSGARGLYSPPLFRGKCVGTCPGGGKCNL